MDVLKFTVVAVCTLFAINAIADGFVQPAPVEIVIDESGEFGGASGDMAWARYYSKGDVASIGCGVRHTDGFTFGFCQATDEDDQYVVCFTENQDLLEAVNAINDYSYITFSWTADTDPDTGDPIPNSGECTLIGISSQSFYLPEDKDAKAPKTKK